MSQARVRATSSGKRLLEALGVLCKLAPMPFIQCLGTPLHYQVFDTDSLFKTIKVFDRVILAQCIKCEFILLRRDDAVICVFADPFETARRAWIEDCLHGAPLYLIHTRVYLERH